MKHHFANTAIPKRITAGILILLLVFLTGCGDQVERIVLEETNYVYGEIVEKPSDGILVLKFSSSEYSEKWGEIVHVVTEQTDEWCVGDRVEIFFSSIERPHDTEEPVRLIANTVRAPGLVYKPIIYLYPEEPTVCSVSVTLDGDLTCTYPAHGAEGWQNFTAHPDGTLVFPDGKEYYALYWEGLQHIDWDFSHGWCVRGEDTASFLEWALAEQGLTPREANEFIVYWLPLMEENPYNVISFQTEAYTQNIALEISPAPDSILRVFMTYYPTDSMVELPPQTFAPFVRQGFTVVEWGGSQEKKP